MKPSLGEFDRSLSNNRIDKVSIQLCKHFSHLWSQTFWPSSRTTFSKWGSLLRFPSCLTLNFYISSAMHSWNYLDHKLLSIMSICELNMVSWHRGRLKHITLISSTGLTHPNSEPYISRRKILEIRQPTKFQNLDATTKEIYTLLFCQSPWRWSNQMQKGINTTCRTLHR